LIKKPLGKYIIYKSEEVLSH